jgi:hypothetical protein
MDRQTFTAQYNARVAEMKAPELAILGMVARDGDAEVLNLTRPGLAMIHFDKPEGQGVIVGCSMREQEAFLKGLVAYGACLDVMMGVSETRRNKLLTRLHLFDGKLTTRGSNLTVKNHLMEVMPHQPEPGMMSFSVTRLRALEEEKPEIAQNAI